MGASTVGEEGRAKDSVQARRRQVIERGCPDIAPGTKGALVTVGETVAGERGGMGASMVGGKEDRANDLVRARRRQVIERDRPDMAPRTKGVLATAGETVAGERGRVGVGAAAVEGGGAEGGRKEGEKEGGRL